MLIKFIKFIKLILRVKINFSYPTHKKTIIFDCVQKEIFLNFLEKKEIYILSVRPERINKIFVNIKLIKFIFQNFWKRSIKLNYLIAVINQIDPKVVVTYIDNSQDFYIISKLLGNKIKFLAIQNSFKRQNRFSYKYQKNTHLPNYCVFGESTESLYKHSFIKKFFFYGSLNLSFFLKKLTKRFKKNKKFTICLLCEYPFMGRGSDEEGADIPNSLISSYINSLDVLYLFTMKFCDKNNYNLIIAGKRFKDTKAFQIEKKFFDNAKKNFDYEVTPRTERFSTHKLITRSDLVIGCNSTMLIEALALKKIIISCNFTRKKFFDMPFFSQKDVLFKDKSYKKFEKKLNYLINIDKNYFFNKLINKNKIIQDSKNTYKKIKRLIKKPNLLEFI